MALDNPSYFSVATGSDPSQPSTSKCSNSKKGNSTSGGLDNISNSSECTLSRQLTPPKSVQQQKKGLRSLLRSVSSTSADSNQELLIMGEPRLSDIAPELAVFKYPSSSEPRRANSLKNKSELHKELLYSPLPTSEDHARDVSDDEVFLTEESARYYNASAMASSRRRHSIGTFMARERTTSIASSSRSFKDDIPQAIVHMTPEGDAVSTVGAISVDDHSLRHGSYPRKRCNRCTRGPLKKTADMDDILIVSFKNSQSATLWVNYFTKYFDQISKQANRRSFKVHHLGIEEIVEANGEITYVAEKTSGVKLQLIVICPSLLDHIAKHPEPSSALGKLIMPDRALALLLGVTDTDVLAIHKTALATYQQWQRLSVGQDQDTNFASNFLSTAMSIFSKVWKKQSSVIIQEKAQFSVIPKKVRPGQNSVVVLLSYPLQKDDIVKISIEKNNELIEIDAVKRRNPYALKINIPDFLTEISAIVNILVEKNGSIIGSRPIKCESRLRELEQILRSANNPIGFMCQALGFSPQDKEQLDDSMHHLFLKNLPPNFNLLGTHVNTSFDHKHSTEEYPTLLHFSAKFGLKKLSMQLLDCPGGDMACEIHNTHNMNPADLAESEGYNDLAHIIKEYMNMNQFTTAYAKLKEISKHLDKPGSLEDEDHYLTPRSLNEVYKICPPPRPVNPIIPSLTENIHPALGYMAMTRPKPDVSLHLSTEILSQHTSFENLAIDKSPLTETAPTKLKTSEISRKNLPQYEDKVQVELLEIINDFKNNVHSIAQAEKLVEEWKNRNDVQMSFKEKQEQLNEMRNRYERMQREMKSCHKKHNPFERFTKLFTRSKNKEEDKSCISLPNTLVIPNQRPISSLSIQSTSSSGSSGRMSTMSGSSLGDSGTHSDHEERKMISSPVEEEHHELNKGIMNYMIPPAPKPVKSHYSKKTNHFPTIQERPPQPVPRPDATEYYIQIPPCNLPVEDSKKGREFVEADNIYLEFEKDDTKSDPNTEYMNVSASGHLEHEQHEYMNFSVPIPGPKPVRH